MAHSPEAPSSDYFLLPSLQKIAYINAAKHVQDFVAQQTNGVLLTDLSEEQFRLFQRLESLQMVKIKNDIKEIFERDVQTALKSYISARYSSELQIFLCSSEADIFGNIEIVVHSNPTTREHFDNSRHIIAGNRVASCGFSDGSDRQARAIFVYFDELMNSDLLHSVDEEDFSDAILQVLLHEYLHAVSAKRYLTKEQEMANTRALVIREEITGTTDVHAEDLASSFGYACNFLDAEGYRIVAGLESFNEAITETIAAKAYSEYTRNIFGKPKRYGVSYLQECRAYMKTLRKFANEWNIPLPQLTKEIELGYLFGDDRRLEILYDRILPMLEHYRSLLEA